MAAKVIGSDLGTTNSCVAVMEGGAPKVLENGLLTIELQREVPEAMRPRRVEIAVGGAAQGPRQIEGQHAA